ncbi:hypothetical protein NDU88_001749 [Pleurodeles waltl]|uniref:Uncharacterized protein n=1 Tax=Pleurodeles waltl TaxID=8319 RepID=A0AAV7P4R6_PLEWA|nr:hypothetical protein NDU88_001749 [Pleurodeles waltl]
MKRRSNSSDITSEIDGSKSKDTHRFSPVVSLPTSICNALCPTAPQKGPLHEAGKYIPPALSSVIKVVPNILCTNRFEPLLENNDMPCSSGSAIPVDSPHSTHYDPETLEPQHTIKISTFWDLRKTGRRS